MPVNSAESHLGIHPWTEPILLWQQVRFEDGTDNQHHRHLNNSVANGRNAQRSLASVALRYPHTQEGLGSVPSRQQLLPQLFQPPFHPLSFDLLEGLTVDARCSRIGMAAAIRLQHDIRSADLIPERIETKGRFCLRFRL